jgi:D-glycero-D-manno-heptose 1,7-bisphosphate phosphatase
MTVSKSTSPRRKRSSKKPCVFLDRDGVLNQGGLIDEPEQMLLIASAADAMARLKKAGYLRIVTTNQSGLGEDATGKVRRKNAPLTRAKLEAIHDRMLELLGPDGKPDDIKICGHMKKLACKCRKPQPGMLNAAAREYKVDKKRSYMIGDMATDIQAGIAAGVTPILVKSGFDPNQESDCPKGTLVFPSLKEAVDYILNRTDND